MWGRAERVVTNHSLLMLHSCCKNSVHKVHVNSGHRTSRKDVSKNCSSELDNLGGKHLWELGATTDTPDKRGLRSVDRGVPRRGGSPELRDEVPRAAAMTEVEG